jgi:hypothetical protein
MGFVRRGVDVTLQASARLLTPLEVVAAHPVGETVGRVLQEHGINAATRGELPVVEAALAMRLDPLELDETLYRLALEGFLIYRGFARAFVLTPGPKMVEDAQMDLSMGEARRVQREMERNLAAMRRYAESLRVSDCLRAAILTYLGAEKPPTRADECCSLCDVNLTVPWADEPAWEDLTDPGRYRDARYTVLKAVAWDAELAAVRGRAPYGAWTLAQILVGNDYMATKYQKDPERKRSRRRHIVASPHFGALEGLSGGADAVLGLVDRLRMEGYVEDVERRWNGGTYTHPAPTAKGKQRLKEGRLFVGQESAERRGDR